MHKSLHKSISDKKIQDVGIRTIHVINLYRNSIGTERTNP